MKRSTGIFAVAALVVATIYLFFDARTESGISQHNQVAAPTIAKSGTRASDNRPVLPPVHNVRPAPLPVDDNATSEVDDDVVAEPASPTGDELRDDLDRLLAGSGTTAWSTSAAQRIEQRMPELLPPGSQLVRVECGTEFCRIQTVHGNLDDFRRFVDQAFLTPEGRLWNGGFFASIVGEPGSGENVQAVAYLAQDGMPLPAFGS